MGAPSDITPFGIELAERVADYLASGQEIAGWHRDDCGMGMVCINGAFSYCHFYDCSVGEGTDGTKDFPDRDSFVKWLSHQSEETVSIDHAPLTVARLAHILGQRR